MNSFDELSIKEIVNEVPDGCLLGVPADYSGVPMEFSQLITEPPWQQPIDTRTCGERYLVVAIGCVGHCCIGKYKNVSAVANL